MKKQILVISMLVASFSMLAKLYYPEMYEPAQSSIDKPSSVITTESVQIEEQIVPDTVLPTTETTVQKPTQSASVVIKESSDTYTAVSTGATISMLYHVVVGSFQSGVNAQNLSSQLQKQGKQASVAVNQDGLYRVFYYSTDNENDARQMLEEARTSYEGAWLLKIKK